jgi:superfamily I DNA and/or RNA helicase
MEFLYSLNRINVATSRAKCVSVLVSSPAVFEAECKTPRQIQLANTFCRYLEMANLINLLTLKRDGEEDEGSEDGRGGSGGEISVCLRAAWVPCAQTSPLG